MLTYNEITQRKYIIYELEPYEVLVSHVFRKQQRKPVNQTKLKNLRTGKVTEISFHQSDKVEEATMETKKIKYLYPNKNEYWFAYAVVVSGGDTPKEDDRIMLSRVNAKNLQVIGEPVQLSQTRIGRNAFAGAHIAYSPKGGGAMAVWGERGREGISGEWGRSIYDDGTLSGEYPVITVGTNPISEGFGVPSIQYNEWTDSFFVPSGDWDGNAWTRVVPTTALNNLGTISPVFSGETSRRL